METLKLQGLQLDLLTVAKELLGKIKIQALSLDILISGETEWCGGEEKGLCGIVCLGLINFLTLGKIPYFSMFQFPNIF